MLKMKLQEFTALSSFINLKATALSIKTTSLIVAIDEAAQWDAHW